MAKSLTKLRIFKLRRQGKSIRQIALATGINVSSVSYWCRNISLTKKQQQILVKNQKSRSYAGRLKSAEKLRKNRIKITRELKKIGAKEIGKLSDREFFMAGIGLYWGEGYRSHEMVGFTSKDEEIIKFIIAWFKRFLKIKNSDLILRVSINKIYKNRINLAQNYWYKITGIPLSQFTKPSIIKSKLNKIYFSNKNYYGTLRITVRRSRNMHRKMMGWIDGLYKNMPM
jgi:hypothetical protein